MAKCTVCLDYDSKLNRVEPCENTGWPELDDLCPEHFREYKIGPAQDKAFDAETFVAELQNRLYNVEVAMGLRSRSYEVGPVKREPSGQKFADRDWLGYLVSKSCSSTVEGTRAATPRDEHVTERASPLSRRVRPSFASQIQEDDDFKEEME